LHEGTAAASWTLLRKGSVSTRAINHPTARNVAAPKHLWEEFGLNLSRVDQDEPGGIAQNVVAENGSEVRLPCACVVRHFPQKYRGVEVVSNQSSDRGDPSDSLDFCEIESLTGQVIEKHLLLTACHFRSHMRVIVGSGFGPTGAGVVEFYGDRFVHIAKAR
jgi:hypothetical protein